MRGWIGKLMRHPDGREGVCTNDDNGVFRVLTVVLDDETSHEIWLPNVGSTREKYRKWAWLYHEDGGVLGAHRDGDEWIEWGEY